VFVTHDQEEAMDVADLIVVMANGKIEQVGAPDDLYDRPANDFVMSFLGPVTKINGRLVRPHDLDVSLTPVPGATSGTVLRIVRLGFEVRVDIETADGEIWAQMTRGEVERLRLTLDTVVYVYPTATAVVVPTPAASAE
jgi:sulfate transport system ATP-binding protein